MKMFECGGRSEEKASHVSVDPITSKGEEWKRCLSMAISKDVMALTNSVATLWPPGLS